MKNSSLVEIAHDGVKLYRTIMKRLAKIGTPSLNSLCRESDVSFSTVYRWSQGAQPEIPTVRKVEAVILRWEAEYHRKNP